MLVRSLVIAAICAAVLPAFAQGLPSAEDLYLRGVFKPGPAKIIDENHQGQELDLHVRRPVVDLTATVLAERYGRPETRLIANFYHSGKFYIARAPTTGVRNVYFVRSFFPISFLGRPISGHSLMRIEMDNPVELVAEMPDEQELNRLRGLSREEQLRQLPAPLTGEGNKITNLAVSAEAQWTKDDPKKEYGLVRGERGSFIQIVRMLSIQTRFEEFYQTGNPTSQDKLNSSGLDSILRESIDKSQSEALHSVYNTINYNCTTLIMDILERALGKSDHRLGFIRRILERRIPIIANYKVDYYGASKYVPMQLDPTLAHESAAAYAKLTASGIDPLKNRLLGKEQRKNISSAIEFIKASAAHAD